MRDLDLPRTPPRALEVVAATLAAVVAPPPVASVATPQALAPEPGGLTISIPVDLGRRLATEARRLGMEPAALAIELLTLVLAPDAPLLDAVLGLDRARPAASDVLERLTR